MFNAQCSIFNKHSGMHDKKYDLEDRLVEYSCRMIDVVDALPSTRAGNYIAGQLIKSCMSPTFNYGEVIYKETEELIAIMAKSIETANKNKLSKNKDT